MHALWAALFVFAVIAQQALSIERSRNTRPITKPLVFASQAEKDAYDQRTKPTGDGQPTGRNPPSKNAGRSTAKFMAHIIGGTRATRGQLPWMVGMIINSASFCGGSLVTTSAVLTAAHCAKNVKKFTIYLGMQNYGAKSETGRVVMTSTKKVVHKGFSKSVLENDIAIVRLPRRVTLGQYINTVKMPSQSDASNTFVGTMATIAGWGLTSDTSGISKELNVLTQREVITNSECAQTYGEIASSMICISGADDKAICSGDSGGPLTYTDSTGASVQIGIVSFSHPASCIGYPQVFSRVTSFLKFISTHTGLRIQK